MLQGDQSYVFWNSSLYKAQAEGMTSGTHRAALAAHSARTSADGSSIGSHLGVPVITTASPLSSEESLNGTRSRLKGEREEQLKFREDGGSFPLPP